LEAFSRMSWRARKFMWTREGQRGIAQEAQGHGFPVARKTLDAIDRLDRIDESWEGKFSILAGLRNRR
jgi:hypothetical protein